MSHPATIAIMGLEGNIGNSPCCGQQPEVSVSQEATLEVLNLMSQQEWERSRMDSFVQPLCAAERLLCPAAFALCP